MTNKNSLINSNSKEITKDINLLELISKATTGTSKELVEYFIQQISHLYQYSIFKNILDLTFTKILYKQLKFIVQNATVFDLDAGNCQTVEMVGDSSIIGWFKPKKNYRITIKKITSEVIIHEICHMVEKEISLFFDLDQFCSMLSNDLKNLKTSNPGLQQKVKLLLVDELRAYPPQQQKGEIFVRYFQLFAGSKETRYGDDSMGQYNINQLLKAFPLATKFLNEGLGNRFAYLIDKQIATISAGYLKNIEEIKPTWADRKIKSIHGKLNTDPDKKKINSKPNWRNNIKSIKDDPF